MGLRLPDRRNGWLTHPQDELWMLKGGKMLCVLRPKRLGTSAIGGVLDATGGPHGPRNLHFQDTGYQLIGEAFMLGLMNSEILDMMGENQNREPPPPLQDMERAFKSIHLV